MMPTTLNAAMNSASPEVLDAVLRCMDYFKWGLLVLLAVIAIGFGVDYVLNGLKGCGIDLSASGKDAARLAARGTRWCRRQLRRAAAWLWTRGPAHRALHVALDHHRRDVTALLPSAAEQYLLAPTLRSLAATITSTCELVTERAAAQPPELLQRTRSVAEQTGTVCRAWLTMPREVRESRDGPDGTTATQKATTTLTTLARAAAEIRTESYRDQLGALTTAANYTATRFGKNELDL